MGKYQIYSKLTSCTDQDYNYNVFNKRSGFQDTIKTVCHMARKQLEKCHMSVVGNMICHDRKCCVSHGQETAGEISHVSCW